MSERDLEEKVWYRFLKIVYIILLIIGFLFCLLVFSDNKPHQVIANRYVNCNNGKTYDADDYSIYSLYLNSMDKRKIYLLCGGTISEKSLITGKTIEIADIDDLLSYKYFLSEDFEKKNYDINETYEAHGGWGEAVLRAIITMFVVFVVLEIIKKTFLYVLIGGNWLKL